MKKYIFILMAIVAMVACSKDDDIKPDNTPKDPITWSRSSYQYPTILWNHHAKGDTCTSSYDYQTFYIGRDYNTGDCYVKHIKATEPIEISINTSDKEICSGCSTFGQYWYHHVESYRYYLRWGGRKYWIKDIPSDIK